MNTHVSFSRRKALKTAGLLGAAGAIGSVRPKSASAGLPSEPTMERFMPSRELFRRLKDAIDTLPVVDTHEHLNLPEETHLARTADFAVFLCQYVIDDLVSAGMPIDDFYAFGNSLGMELRAGGRVLDHDEKWAHIRPYWEQVKRTGYGRAVRLSLAKFYGIDDLTDDTVRTITKRLAEVRKPGMYRAILADMCGISTIINDGDPASGAFDRTDGSLFRFVARFRDLVYCYRPGALADFESRFGRSIRSIGAIEEVIDTQVSRWVEEGRVAAKCADAYIRDIGYEKSTRDDAERAFNRMLTLRTHVQYPEQLSPAEARPLENYITHRVIERLEAEGLPLIVHTGYQARNQNVLTDSRATLLIPLLYTYPRLRVHLLHANYPWMGEAASMAKQFPHVTLDLTWVQAIVPAGARAGLADMLDMVPLNKIHVFGGDWFVPYNCWGSLEIARENTAHVLAEKVESGWCTESEAVAVARQLFADNAREIFRLE